MAGLADLLPQLLTRGAPGGSPPPPPTAMGHPSPGGPPPSGLPMLPPGQAIPPGMPSPAAISSPVDMPSTPIPEGGMSGAGAPPSAPGGSAAGGSVGPDQGMPNASALPPPPQYATETQADGSILLRIQNPDGSMGPAVKIVRAPKRALNAEQSAAQVK